MTSATGRAVARRSTTSRGSATSSRCSSGWGTRRRSGSRAGRTTATSTVAGPGWRLASRESSIPAYYDGRAGDAIRDFVDGNPRIERAWRTLDRLVRHEPERILEIGCGVGAVSWRMSRRWPGAEVTGLDISPQSIAYAERLFGPDGVRFVEGALPSGDLAAPFDLVVLFDVYEHVGAT